MKHYRFVPLKVKLKLPFWALAYNQKDRPVPRYEGEDTPVPRYNQKNQPVPRYDGENSLVPRYDGEDPLPAASWTKTCSQPRRTVSTSNQLHFVQRPGE